MNAKTVQVPPARPSDRDVDSGGTHPFVGIYCFLVLVAAFLVAQAFRLLVLGTARLVRALAWAINGVAGRLLGWPQSGDVLRRSLSQGRGCRSETPY